ncbi:hypothetical protein [Streptomyces pratensis]|uniref:hypothetical protein n=1 Tax=Streptomyces pratensis TaxID=1169025 RepID=UPI001933FF2F|nr:hypothetical protein [Streptomyces pratensis]
MTSDAGRTDDGVRYADGLTAELVWEVGDFLLPRLERAARAHPPGSEEGITASALAEAVAALVLTLDSLVTRRRPARVRVHAGMPPAPVPTDEERRTREKERLERIRRDWNHLCDLAGHWRSVPGYPGSHWRGIDFRDTGHEEWYAERAGHVAGPPVRG